MRNGEGLAGQWCVQNYIKTRAAVKENQAGSEAVGPRL